jgi:hypothetical protein
MIVTDLDDTAWLLLVREPFVSLGNIIISDWKISLDLVLPLMYVELFI